MTVSSVFSTEETGLSVIDDVAEEDSALDAQAVNEKEKNTDSIMRVIFFIGILSILVDSVLVRCFLHHQE